MHFVVRSEVTVMERSLTGFCTGCKISDCAMERELPKLMIFVVTSVTNEDVLQS